MTPKSPPRPVPVIALRLGREDHTALQAQAAELGIPVATLVRSLVHQALADRPAPAPPARRR